MIKFVANFISLKKVYKISLKIVLALVALIVILWILLQTTFFQNFIIGRVTHTLSKNLNTTVRIGHVDFDLFDKMLLENTLILDHHQDTLLHAGTVKLSITDWFFLKDDITLKYLGLEDASVYLHRSDPEWNYQFLIEYFSGGKKKKKTSRPIHLDLKTVHLSNVRILQKDEWKGVDMLTAVEELQLTADELNLEKKILDINSITLDEPVFTQYDYEGLRPKNRNSKRKIKLPEAVNADNWKVSVNKIIFKNGIVSLEREGTKIKNLNRFDERNIVISNLDGLAMDVQLLQDTLTAQISLSGRDRGDFQIKELKALYRLTPHMMEFKNLSLKTANSHLKDYFAMHYQSFNKDMQDFVHAVDMEGHFKNSILSSEDLAYFAPQVRDWNTRFVLNGKVSGKVDNLTAQNISVKAGENNFVSGDLSLRGLPGTDETFIDFRIEKLLTSYDELSNIFPSLRGVTQPNLSAFGHINYSGSFTGYFHNFVTYGTLKTDIGTLKTDLQMQLPDYGPPTYSGRLSTKGFQLGKFINSEQIGLVSFDGKLKGKGFNGNNIQLSIDGAIQQIQFRDYNYSNILAHGYIQGNLFTGSASINDKNIKIDTLIGAINFSSSHPAFHLKANVLRLNTRNLGFTNDSISLTGKLLLDFSGSNIDNFLGTARITDAVLIDEGRLLSFDSLKISSSLLDSTKLLSLQTNELEAVINGNFTIHELPRAFQLFLNKYYPVYINQPRENVSNQDFSFLIQTKNISEYVSLFDKRLSGFNDATIRGAINIQENLLDIEAGIPQIKYSNFAFEDITFSGESNGDSLVVNAHIEDVVINDSLHSPNTEIQIVAANDISDVVIQTSGNNNLNSAHLSFRVATNENGFKLKFNPSTFTLNQKQWTIQKNGEIELDGKMLMAGQLRLFQNGQEILVYTMPSSIGNSNDVIISASDLNLEDLAPLFIKSPGMRGYLSGNIRINDPFDKLSVTFNTRIDEFFFEQDSIGVLQVKGDYDEEDESFKGNLVSDNELYNFSAQFGYIPSDSVSPLQGLVTFNHSGIHVLDHYLGEILKDIRGRATGELSISGKVDNPKLVGSIRLDSAAMTVVYTQCRYAFENNSVINFNPDEIDFGTIKIYDANNQSATLSGKIYHDFFNRFYFNELHLRTNESAGGVPKFLLLNTTSLDNEEFYGKVIGRAEMSLNGFITDMRMSIRGTATDSSHIYLPIDETAETGSLNYIDFIKFGREMKPDTRVSRRTNITVDMTLIANPLATIDVILDETTNDVIRAHGNGRLDINVGTRDPLTIRGRYNITEGKYTFNFQTFLRTPFILQGGYIEWSGDPYLAQLHINAIYRAENVDLSNIPTSTGFTNIRGDINILFHLRGTLKDPAPEFEFQFPFDNPLKSDPIASQYIKTRYENDNNQLLNQVASLLLFNSFMTNDQGLLTANSTGNFVTKSVGQLLSSTLSSSLNNWLQKLIKTKSVNLYTNINTSDLLQRNSLTPKELQYLGNFGLRTSFLDGKLLINLGGNLDYTENPALRNSNSNFLFTPDVSFEYLITPDGRLRVIGFNRSDADPGDIAGVTRRNRTGIQLSFRKDFDSFEEFFTGKR